MTTTTAAVESNGAHVRHLEEVIKASTQRIQQGIDDLRENVLGQQLE